MEICNKQVLVIGMARSGVAAAKLANQQGAKVSVYDAKTFDSFDGNIRQTIQCMKEKGIKFYLGENINIELFDMLIVSPGVPLDIDLIKEAYSQGKNIIGELEFASQYCKAPIIAITGTNGKTTTTTLVGEIIKAYNKDTYVVGNIGKAFSEEASLIPENGTAVAEVSSFQLETIKTFHPKVSGILNITPDHLNRHKTMENYVEAKCKVFENQTEQEYVVLNENDAYYDYVKERVKGTIVTFNIEKAVSRGAYVINHTIYENIHGVENRICSIEELKILGAHNVENALAAVAITRCFHVPVEIVRKQLVAFKGVEHRIEYVGTKKGVDFFNDSKATNTDAAIKGILAMRKPTRLIAGGMDKKCSFIDWIKLFEGRVIKVYILGETQDQIEKECNELGYYHTEKFETFEQAVKKAYEEASQGEAVLLSPACASWDMFESYEQRGELFKHIINHLEG